MDGITFYGRYFNVITMNTQSQKVSMAEKIGYSLGDGSANLIFQMMMMFQLFFYTDVFGIKATAAGMILLVARIFDAFVDPVVPAGVNTVPGCCGQLFLLPYSSFWHLRHPI